MERRKIRNYDLYRGHAYYVPGVGGMFALFGWFLLGGLLGGAVTAILTYFLGAEFTTTYGMLIVYPLQFMPAMMYAAFQSRKNALFEKGYALDSKHFGRFGFALCAVLVVLGTTDSKVGAGNFAGLAIGLSLILVHLVCINLTGTSVNPARSIGPALFACGDALKNVWVFICAPLVGGALSACVWCAIAPKEK